MIDQLEIAKNNELIAKFLGWFQEEGQEGTWFYVDDSAKRVAYSIHNNYPHRDLPFHRSWEWLMPVVEKINKFHVSERPFKYGKPESVKLKIHEDKVTVEGSFWTNPNTVDGNHWSYLKIKKFKYSDNTLIECVYMAVVEFVKWYNKNKS
jgi:hypothetical protein